jgi:pyruvate dehydrogenase E2 component (dihydrolipoamide acetyltransferase)
MAKVLELPAVAAGSTEAVVAEWMVEENASFGAGDVLATIETEKALVEVEAEAAGVILKALVPAGALAEVGAPIAVLGEQGEQIDDVDAVLAELGVTANGPVVRPERREVPETSAAGPESLAAGPETSAAGHGSPAGGHEASTDAPGDRGDRIFISPLARRLARDAGLTPADIPGTGPNGRIVRRDVDAAIAARNATTTTTATTPTATSAGAAAPPSAASAGAGSRAGRGRAAAPGPGPPRGP